jgi:hypothetical protein
LSLAQDDVDFGTYITIQDAAKGAGLQTVFVPKQQPGARGPAPSP